MDRSAEDVTASFAAVGTAPYMAPEQAEGRKVGPAVDIYGLGAVLYAMLCGRPPHRGRSGLDTLRRVVADEIVPPRRLRRDVPRDLEAGCLQCLEKDPARRYSGARDLADDLGRFLAGEPTRARPPGRWETVRRKARRHPAALVVLVLCMAFAGTFLGGGHWFRTRLEETRDISRQFAEQARLSDRAARRARYVTDVRQAAQFARSHQTTRAVELLMRHRPQPDEADPREFTWRHLLRRCHTERLTLSGHRGQVYHAEFSPDGRTLASSGQDGTVRLWDPTSGSLIRVIQAHESEVNWVTFSPDGRTLATTSDDGTVQLRSVSDDRKPLVIPAHRGIAVIVLFTPDGKRVISCGRDDGEVKTWDAATGRALDSFHAQDAVVENMALSPDGATLAVTGQRQKAAFWDLTRLRRVAGLGAHQGHVFGVAFSGDGKRLATACEDRILRLWEAPSGRLVHGYAGHSGCVYSVAVSPDGRWLISAGDDETVRLWDVATGELQGVHMGHLGRIWGVSVSRDGRTIASASHDGTVELWDIRAPEIRTRLSARGRLKALAFSADNRVVTAAGADGVVWTWDVATGRPRESRRLGDAVIDVALDRTGSLAAVHRRDGVVEIHDLTRGHPVRSIGPIAKDMIWMEFDPEARRLAVSVFHEGVTLWDVETAKRTSIFRDDVQGRPLFSPNGALLCSAGPQQDLIVWNPSDDATTRIPGSGWYASQDACLSPDGSLMAKGSFNQVHLSGLGARGLQEGLEGHRYTVVAVAFSPDGETLASGGEDGSVKLWDITALEELLTLESHAGPVRMMQFSPDGKVLATCADRPDGTSEVFLWRAAGR